MGLRATTLGSYIQSTGCAYKRDVVSDSAGVGVCRPLVPRRVWAGGCAGGTLSFGACHNCVQGIHCSNDATKRMIGSFDPGFVMERQRALEVWLYQLLASKPLRKRAAVTAALETNKQDQDVNSTGPPLSPSERNELGTWLNPLSSQTIRRFLTLRANREPKELKMNIASLEAERTRRQKERAHDKKTGSHGQKGQSSDKISLEDFELTQV